MKPGSRESVIDSNKYVLRGCKAAIEAEANKLSGHEGTISADEPIDCEAVILLNANVLRDRETPIESNAE